MSHLTRTWELRKPSYKLSLLKSRATLVLVWPGQESWENFHTNSRLSALINSHATLVVVWPGHESWENSHTNPHFSSLINSRQSHATRWFDMRVDFQRYSPHRRFVDHNIYYWAKFLTSRDRFVSQLDRNCLSSTQAVVCSNQTRTRASWASRASWYISARFLLAGHEERRCGSNFSVQAKKSADWHVRLIDILVNYSEVDMYVVDIKTIKTALQEGTTYSSISFME